MKNLILLIFVIATSCKTTECWVEAKCEPIVYHDTLTIPSIHFHYHDMEGLPHCAWIDKHEIPYIDTIQPVWYEWEKTRPCNCVK